MGSNVPNIKDLRKNLIIEKLHLFEKLQCIFFSKHSAAINHVSGKISSDVDQKIHMIS